MVAFWDLAHRCKTRWPLLAPLLVASVAGMVGGWYFYWSVGQFDPGHPEYVHWAWWPLVSDSPNAVLLWFAAALAYKLTGWRHRILDSLAFVLNMYVGVWTTYLFVTYADRMGTYAGGTNTLLFFTHMGMPLLALVLVHDLRRDLPSIGEAIGIVAFSAIFVYVDYWGPVIHPAPNLHPNDAALHTWSPWIMVGSVVVWAAATYVWAPGAGRVAAGVAED